MLLRIGSLQLTGSPHFDSLFLGTMSMSADSLVVIPATKPAISELYIELGKETTLLHRPKMDMVKFQL